MGILRKRLKPAKTLSRLSKVAFNNVLGGATKKRTRKKKDRGNTYTVIGYTKTGKPIYKK